MSSPDVSGGSPEGQEPRAKFIVRGQSVAGEKKRRARELRREMTPAARVVWELVRCQGCSISLKQKVMHRLDLLLVRLATRCCHERRKVVVEPARMDLRDSGRR